ncbi:hypothetical protein AB4Y45_35225 [Paraburkholderia sp. EG287A]|uniref:hypothetical protein n=1 Tax=Paraburkholderia sp. EG287A TaxID=3237012 RepID=UPI0034D2B701
MSLLNSWRTAFPDMPLSTGPDFEDWVENAVRLDSALRLAPERLALVDHDGNARYLDGRAVPADQEVQFLGSWSNADNEHRRTGVFASYRYPALSLGDASLAHNYAQSEVFRANAGREIVLCGRREEADDPVDLDIFDVLSAAYARGARRMLIKVKQKYAVFRFIIPSSNPREIEDKLTSENPDFGLALVHLAGRNKMFMVQDFIPMAYEYRVIVFDHEPVAGAGCVEAHTPLDNEAVWDPKVEEVRSSGEVEARPDLAARYAEFAREFVQDYNLERPSAGKYTLDLAISNGRVVVIELNPMRNYGLYAMDFDAVLRAQMK